MPDTPNLALPLIAAAQAQKHVTHNDALLALDALLQCAVKDKDLAAPPSSPADGDRYIVAASPSGAWAGKAGQVAAWQDGAWRFYAAKAGFMAFVVDELSLYYHDGSAWVSGLGAIAALQNLALLGVGATADGTNPFSAKLNNALWAAKTVAEGGDGSLRYKLSKESAAKTLSLLLQDNFSGRAEIGLTGDDDLHVKVSAEGATWFEALKIDRTSGAASFPNGLSAASLNGGAVAGLRNRIVNGNFAINQRGYASGAALSAGAYGLDRWKAGGGGCAMTFGAASPNRTVTITAGTLVQVIEDLNVEGGTYTLSWSGSAQGRIAHSGGTPAGAYAGSPITVTGAAAGQTVTVEFGLGTLGTVQLEPGATATPYEPRPYGLALMQCQRYFEAGHFSVAGYQATGNATGHKAGFKATKRTIPTIALSNVDYLNATGATADMITYDDFRIYGIATASNAIRVSANWTGLHPVWTGQGA